MTDRAVSTVVSYVLVVGIVAILATMLVGGFAPFVTNQQEDTAQATLETFGNDLAGDIDTADRLAAAAGANGTVVLRTDLPRQVAGDSYEITIAQDAGTAYVITLSADGVDATAVVNVRTQIPVEEQTGANALDGGDLRITYDTGSDTLVVQNA